MTKKKEFTCLRAIRVEVLRLEEEEQKEKIGRHNCWNHFIQNILH